MTRILVCGAGGLIGKAIAQRLAATGATVLRGVRVPRAAGDIRIDYARDTDTAVWRPRLEGIDVVVNAVGIIVERRGQCFEDIHFRAPRALFDACREAGVQRVLQVSALGAADGQTPYFRSKRSADEHLMALDLAWQIVRPGLVYADDGASATMFRQLASLPVVALPGGGGQRLQPIHIDDLVEAVLRLVDPAVEARLCVDLVGPVAITYRQMLVQYRQAMGFAPAFAVPIPSPAMALAARVAGLVPGSVLTPDTWKMLQSGNTADAGAVTSLLGHEPRPVARFIESADATALRAQALAQWRLPLFRATLACVWIATALLSAGIFPRDTSLAMIHRLRITGGLAVAALYAGVLIDLACGVASLAWPGRRLWALQIAIVLAYSVLIAVGLPEFLVHPFGPVLKNLPILAMLAVLLAEEPRP